MPPLRQFDQEDYQALPLALVGLGKGIFEVVIRPEISRDRLAFIGGLVIGGVVTDKLTH